MNLVAQTSSSQLNNQLVRQLRVQLWIQLVS